MAIFLWNPDLHAQLNCYPTNNGIKTMQSTTIELIRNDGSVFETASLIADDGLERAAGFQYICPQVIEETKILFSYSSELVARFHMSNVFAPLDIAFFDAQGQLVKWMLMETYAENSKPLYGPDKPFQFALEARQGFLAEHNLTEPGLKLNLVRLTQ